MTAATFEAYAPAAEETIPRDRWGRPLIIVPDADKPVPYTRASTLGKVLEEQSQLAKWLQRMTLIGATLKPELVMAAAAARDDRNKMNDLCEQAAEAAGSTARRELGTALHAVTQAVDEGRDPGPFPAQYHGDVTAYRMATGDWVYPRGGIERFVVCDQLKAAGTFDRLRVVPPKGRSRAKPKLRVVDLKTGSSVAYAWLSIAVQLAIYANGEGYDPATGARTPLGLDPATGEVLEVDTKVAEVVWLPAGEGRCEVYEVDISAGWSAAQIAVSVKALRSAAKKWATPAGKGEPTLADLVTGAPSVEALGQLWETRHAEFTPEVGELATARYNALVGGLVAAS